MYTLEVGGINTNTGAEVVNNDRSRTNYLNLKTGDVISFPGLYCYLIKYTSVGGTGTLITNGRADITVASDGIYRMMFTTGNTSSVYDALKITRISDRKTLEDLTEDMDRNFSSSYIFHENSATGAIVLPNIRAFTSEYIPANQYIDSFILHQKSIASSLDNSIEIWSEENGVLKLEDTIIYKNSIAEEKDVTVSYGKSYSKNVRIAIVYGASGTAFTMVAATGNDRDVRTTDKTSTQISVSDLYIIAYRINIKAVVYKSTAYLADAINNLSGSEYNIVRIGKYERFKEIQDALDYYTDDASSNQYVFKIMPGTYKKFSMTTLARVRYVSMIGVCKTDCIIRDDSGQYNNAPALVFTNGMFKNLTFIATHDNPPAYEDREDAAHKSYALHMDCGTQDVLFDDCVFISYQAPAVGIGCYQNVKYHFKNCEMYSYTPAYDDTDTDYRTNWTLLANYGGFFAHSNTGDNVTNQRLILDNCRIYSNYGTKGMWIATAGSFTGGEMLLSLMNNMAISYAAGSDKAVISQELTIMPESFGNNWDA